MNTFVAVGEGLTLREDEIRGYFVDTEKPLELQIITVNAGIIPITHNRNEDLKKIIMELDFLFGVSAPTYTKIKTDRCI